MELIKTLSKMVMEQHLMELEHGALVINLLKMLLFLFVTTVHQYILKIVKMGLVLGERQNDDEKHSRKKVQY